MAYRKLEINGETWKYVIGQGVKIVSPDGKSIWKDGWEIRGFESKSVYLDTINETYDEDRESYRSIPITPKMVREYIEEKLIEG